MRKECMFVNTCMDACMKNLRRNLMDEMIRRRISVVHMAIECNVSYETFYGILRNRYDDMRLSTLKKISDGLGRSVESLITYPEEEWNGGQAK